LATALGGLAWLYADIMAYAQHTAEGDGVEKTVLIHPGETFSEITGHLNQAGIVTQPLKFRLYARLKGYDNQLKAGEYSVSTNMSPDRVLATLVSGKVRLHRLTIPEGLSLRQIATLVADARLCSASEFLKLSTDAALAEKLGIPAPSLEGYLFPETYRLPVNGTPEDLISRMLTTMESRLPVGWQAMVSAQGLTMYDVLTVASIVEREAVISEERSTKM